MRVNERLQICAMFLCINLLHGDTAICDKSQKKYHDMKSGFCVACYLYWNDVNIQDLSSGDSWPYLTAGKTWEMIYHVASFI